MSGIMFVISLPSEEYERSLLSRFKNGEITKTNHSDFPVKLPSPTLLESGIFPFEDKKTDSMQKVLKVILAKLNVENATWCLSSSKKYWQVTFTLESRIVCEHLLTELRENKIGDRLNSVVSVIPCIYHHENSEDDTDDALNVSEKGHHHCSKNTGWHRFVSSVRSRLTVAQVVENIKANAMLTFDFVCFLTIAIILCAIGLVENNNLYLISSMLLSPMMGPVIASTFGTVIRDKKLQKMGVLNEILGLVIAVFVGFLYGSVICIMTDKYGEQEWPTYAMTSMGEIRTLWVGCLIALLSGAAVALGVLSDNTTSIVGVAISTSLMPTTVNAGLLWSLATVYYYKGNATNKYASLSHTTYYSENQGIELAILGGVSMSVTITNIIFIYIAGILVFMVKEVAPMASRDQEKRRFWKYDIKVARDYNRTLQYDEANNFNSKQSKMFTVNVNNLNELRTNRPKHGTITSYTWSPYVDNNSCTSVKELKELYKKLRQEKASYSKPLNFTLPSSQTRTRRLSQLFSSSKSVLEENNAETEKTPLLAENNKQCNPKKKFVVTPCEFDPLYEK